MIGIIGAMEEEVAKLVAQMEDVTIIRQACMEFHTGKLCGRDAVVVRSYLYTDSCRSLQGGFCDQYWDRWLA